MSHPIHVVMGNEVIVSSAEWMSRGGKMMRWIHDTIDEHCYRLRFNRQQQDFETVTLIFEDASQAMWFRLACLPDHVS